LGYELDRIFEVALKNAEHRQYSRPGNWNDPDYLQIGYVGAARGEGEPRPCPLTPNEQYSFVSLWSLMASPLFYSGAMNRLDKFTLSLLCNPEVIDVDQDPLGQSARVVQRTAETFLMVKDLEDGGKAVGLFNRGPAPAAVACDWADARVSGKQTVRDLWRQKEVGTFDGRYEATVARHGVVLVRLTNASATAR
jgi:alpha-galactosidase